MKKSSIKSFVANHSICLSKIYNILCFNRQRINGKGNSINKDGAFMRRCIIRVDGNNNILVLNAVGGVIRLIVLTVVFLMLLVRIM